MPYILPHSFMIFLVTACFVAAAIFWRRRKFPARPDWHMRFIYAGAVLPLISAFTSAYFSGRDMMAIAKDIPVWVVYWTLFDIVYHVATKKRAYACAAFALLFCLLFFGALERIAG